MEDNFVNIGDKIHYILDEMEMVYKNDNRPWIIGYSGGKDSTTVVQLVYQMLLRLPEKDRNKDVYIVSSNTLVENPIILAYLEESIKKISTHARENNLPIKAIMVHPEYNNSFWTNIIGKGFPTPKSARFRWCTDRLKIFPSNKFINERVEENGEVIVLLGVRKAESIARRNRIEARAIDGYLLTPHGTLENTYVYNPIVELTVDDVWEILLANGGKNPWNGNNNTLFQLYKDSDGGECPFIMQDTGSDLETPTCANTRFGCWTCTVVKEDRSLQGFIESGEEWLIPLAGFREWLLDIRDNREYREKRQRSGRIYRIEKYKKNLSQKEIEQLEREGYKPKLDKKGEEYYWVRGLGPFNFEGRKKILRRLLELENQAGMELITLEELREIDKIWDEELDLERNTLCDIYEEVKGKKLPWASYKMPLFEGKVLRELEIKSEEYEIEKDLIKSLLIQTDKYKHFSNKSKYRETVDKLLNQQWLHKELYDEEHNYED